MMVMDLKEKEGRGRGYNAIRVRDHKKKRREWGTRGT
jgi:hypothetical protein